MHVSQPRTPRGVPTGGQFAAQQHPESEVVLAEPTRLWREENEGIFRATIDAAAEQLDLQPLAVEKDYWVCQALRAIEAHAPGETIFKGGTSLEKLRLIKRFSEDLDLLVVGEYESRGATERAFRGMCTAAEAAIPGCEQEKFNSGGKPGSMHRSVHLNLPLGPQPSNTAIANPGAILVELGQSGGRHPSSRERVDSLLSRQLAASGVEVASHVDVAPFEVEILHPGRTLIEKLLRVNNFVVDEARRDGHDGSPRIGRQFYDIWALLGDERVQSLLADADEAANIMADCVQVSLDFRPDLEPPDGGFSACHAFDPSWTHSPTLRSEHERAMEFLYYGTTPAPTFDEVLSRVHQYATALDIQVIELPGQPD